MQIVMKKQWSLIIAVVLVLIVAILSVLNVDPVPVNFGFTEVEWPLILVIIGSLLIGAIISSLFSTVKIYQERKERKRIQKDLDSADSIQHQKVEETEEKYKENILVLEAELDKEKKKVRDLERRLSNTEKNYTKEL